MTKFHKLTVSEVIRETPDCVSVAFTVPDELKNEYTYIQGQHLTLKLLINGEEVRRSYSICSSPATPDPLRVAIKRVNNGKASNYLNEHIKAGDTLEVMTPTGNFHTELKSSNRKQYVLFAGGSGITPMMSIIGTTLLSEPQSKLTLFYGNLNETQTIFRKQLDEIAVKESTRFSLHYILEKPEKAGFPQEFTGLMTKDLVKRLLLKHAGANPVTEYFICGPGAMMDQVKEALEENNVNRHFIHIEYFTAATEEAKEVNTSQKAEAVISEVTVIMDGKETVFSLSSGGKAILDAAIDAGIDAPFSCKGAVCATCKAKLKEGKVSMDLNYALTDDEVEEGYILTCQSHPVSPAVTVDYDQV